MIKLLAILLMTTACGQYKAQVYKLDLWMQPSGFNTGTNTDCSPDASMGSIDPELQRYVAIFFEEAVAHEQSNCKKIESASFFDASEADGLGITIGMCYPQLHTIKIYQPWWDGATQIERIATIFHESGHCALMLEHAPQESINIMTPYIIPDQVLEDNWPELLDKLFFRLLD